MITAIEILFLVRVVHVEPAVIGLLLACGGVGGVLGAVATPRIARRIGGPRATILGIALNAGILLLPLSTTASAPALFSVGWFVVGFGVVLYNVNQVSFRQRLCPPELLGRMNATMRFVVWGVLPLGSLVGGVLGQKVGLRPTLWIGAVGTVSAIGWLFASPLAGMRSSRRESRRRRRVGDPSMDLARHGRQAGPIATVSPMPTASANGIELCYEIMGSGDPLLLVHGLGGQLIDWHDDLCRMLVDQGLSVTRYDNRDVGLSTKFEEAPTPNLGAIMGGARRRRPTASPTWRPTPPA